ncbi:hypothetical protein Aduo_008493 [Ancylostoma duodenale]
MSTSTTVKRLITRSLNALKDACLGIEDQDLLAHNQEQDQEWGPDYSVEQKKQSLLAAQKVLETALESVSQRWEQTISEAGKLSDPEGTPTLMDEYQLHWKNQDGDGIMLKAKNLLQSQSQNLNAPTETSEQIRWRRQKIHETTALVIRHR